MDDEHPTGLRGDELAEDDEPAATTPEPQGGVRGKELAGEATPEGGESSPAAADGLRGDGLADSGS